MTRLFVQFYIGVILILLVALSILAFAARYRIDTDFTSIKERELGGGMRLAREALKAADDDDATNSLGELQEKLGYPIQIIVADQLADEVLSWLSKGDDVLVHVDNELSVFTTLENGTNALQLGPISLRQGTIETDMIVAMGAFLLLAAIAIAVLLRPLTKQLGLLEETAISIAGGNLSARVNLQKVDSAKTVAQAFNGMAERVEVMLKTQRELLQAVSHELRTPLASINFASELIRTARDDGEREARLESLDTAAQELDELVGELLQYVRLETSGPQSDCEYIELMPLVEELIKKASFAGDRIQFEIGPELKQGSIHLVADPIGLRRAIGNLLANASRFAQQFVIVDAVESMAGITIDVDDDGPGIPEPDRGRVFEPFVRLEETSRGAGLGLALVKRIIINHGGTVTALESPLGGCRICMFWPATTAVRDQNEVPFN
jgi:two-component system sensor histidine kinase RstB